MRKAPEPSSPQSSSSAAKEGRPLSKLASRIYTSRTELNHPPEDLAPMQGVVSPRT